MAEIKISSPIIVSGGGASITGASTLTGVYQETIAAGDPVYVIDQPYVPAVPSAGEWELANITDLSEGYIGYGKGVAFSPNGDYLAIAGGSNPNLRIYKRNGDSFSACTVTTTPTYDASQVTWSTDSNYLFCSTITNSSYSIESVFVYTRTGDTFAKTGSFANTSKYTGSLKMDVTNTYLVVGGSYDGIRGAAGGIVLKHDGSGGLTELKDFAESFQSASWNNVTGQLMFTQTASPYIRIFTRTGDTFTEDTTPIDTLPAAYGYAQFSNDGNYIMYAVNSDATPSLYTYKRNGITYEKLPNIAGDDGQGCYRPAWNEDDSYIMIPQSTTDGRGQIIKRVGDVFTIVGTPAFINSQTNLFAAFSSAYLALAQSYTAGVQILKTSVVSVAQEAMDAQIEVNKSSLDPTEVDIENFKALGYATSSGVADDSKEVATLWEVV